MPTKLTAKFRITTPMFLGGSAQQPTDGIRAPSVKGHLRFWWRALHWSESLEDESGDESAALRRLHGKEARVFGSAATPDGAGGQGTFLLRSPTPAGSPLQSGYVHPNLARSAGGRYQAFRLVEAVGTQAGQLLRGCIDGGKRFDLDVRSRGDVDPSVLRAMMAFGLLGGLGARWRHGLGSVALAELGDEAVPVSEETYVAAVRALVPQAAVGTAAPTAGRLPPFTAFGPESRIDIVARGQTAHEVLGYFGERMMAHRGWAGDKNFPYDYAWGKKTSRPRGFHPRRVVFGLPHNYGNTPDLEVKPERQNRRASPLLFHVHEVGRRDFIGVTTFLPAVFLPRGERINAGGSPVAPNIDWSVVTDFLDGTDGSGAERFPDRCPVLGPNR